MKTHRIICQPRRCYNILESGPTFNSTTIINIGDYLGNNRCSSGGFWRGFGWGSGVCFGSMFANVLDSFLGRCAVTTGRGGSKQVKAPKTTTTTTTVVQEDKDQPKISDLIKKVEAFDKNPTEAEAKALYKDLKKLSEKPIDDVNKQTNIDTYKHLLDHITRVAEDKGWKLDGDSGITAVKPKNKKDETKPKEDDPFKDFDNISWNDGATAPDKDTLDKMNKGNNSFATANDINNNTKFKKIHDTGTKTLDVNASKTDKSGKVSYISGQTGEGGFPLYLIANDNGGSYKYKLLNVVDHKAIYTTPAQDRNKNVYVLLKDSSGDLILWQDKKFSGHNKCDTQNK